MNNLINSVSPDERLALYSATLLLLLLVPLFIAWLKQRDRSGAAGFNFLVLQQPGGQEKRKPLVEECKPLPSDNSSGSTLITGTINPRADASAQPTVYPSPVQFPARGDQSASTEESLRSPERSQGVVNTHADALKYLAGIYQSEGNAQQAAALYTEALKLSGKDAEQSSRQNNAASKR